MTTPTTEAQERRGTVAVIGAGQCGRMTAQRVAESDVFETVLLVDVIDGLAEGIALDINQSRAIVGFETTVVGRTIRIGDHDHELIADAEIVVIAAGAVPEPHWSVKQLIRANEPIVRSSGGLIAHGAPSAVVIVMTNPVDVMTAIAHEATGFPPRRVMGQSVLLDTSRFADFVAEQLSVLRSSVNAIVVGSHAHDRSMMPLLSSATVDAVPLTSMLDGAQLNTAVSATRRGGSDVARMLNTHSSFYAPSAAAARMVRAVKDDNETALPVCAYLEGAYGIRDAWLGVPARLGRNGVQEIVELALPEEEYMALAAAAKILRAEQREILAPLLTASEQDAPERERRGQSNS
ncbi:malate dehydrogenase [Streptomyces amakusaensis]|uniref:Malate dehydrogenase n=1 Tax=Streptomyces amakusaensis TaxID=67271 RepID=A0ABW0AFZ2_9ACTN